MKKIRLSLALPLVLHLFLNQMLFCQKTKLWLGKQLITTVTITTLPQSKELINSFGGKVDSMLHEYFSARTWQLNDERILLEFFSGEAAVFSDKIEFLKAANFQFLKNTIPFLKKDITYKVELDYQSGMLLLSKNKAKKLSHFKSGAPEIFRFDVYELPNGQVAYVENTTKTKAVTLYENLKALCSENNTVSEEFYAGESEKKNMKKLAKGDPMMDYVPNEHFLYPEYLKRLIKNHKLKLVETKIPVSRTLYANLYRSQKGYYMLIDDFSQKNYSGTAPISIGIVRIYNTTEELKEARENFAGGTRDTVFFEHFFQKLSDRYGAAFGRLAPELADSLIPALNLGLSHLTYSHTEIELIDAAIKWQAASGLPFNIWFPFALAYYGEFYMRHINSGCWQMHYDNTNQVWIPGVMLNDKKEAFDVFDFYKNLLEGPIPLKLAGDYDGFARRLKNKR